MGWVSGPDTSFRPGFDSFLHLFFGDQKRRELWVGIGSGGSCPRAFAAAVRFAWKNLPSAVLGTQHTTQKSASPGASLVI